MWVQLPAAILRQYIDIIKTPAAQIDKILTTMTNIELRFNKINMKIVDMSKCQLDLTVNKTLLDEKVSELPPQDSGGERSKVVDTKTSVNEQANHLPTQEGERE